MATTSRDTLAGVEREPDWTRFRYGASRVVRLCDAACRRIGSTESRHPRRPAGDWTVPSRLTEVHDGSGSPTPHRCASAPPGSWRSSAGRVLSVGRGRTCVHRRTVEAVSACRLCPRALDRCPSAASDRDVAITPDGPASCTSANNGTQLFVRALDALEPTALAEVSRRRRSSRQMASGSVLLTGQTLKKVSI